MKKVFIKVQSSVGQSWADSIESINAYSAGISDDPVQNLRNQKNYDQKVNVYAQISNLIKLSPANGNFKVEVAVKRGEGGEKEINMSQAFAALKSSNGSYDVIHYGYIFDETGRAKDVDVIDNSKFFARDPDSGRLVDAVTEEEITNADSVQAAVWFSMYRIRATEIYYIVINPNLIAVPDELSGTFGDTIYYHLNTSDGTFRTKVLAPNIKGGTLVGNNIIVATADSVEIDTFGLSMLHYESGEISQDNIPSKIEMIVKSSLDTSRTGSVITVNMNKPVGTLSYQWITGSYLDSSLVGNESLKYDFVLIKE